MRYDPLSDEEMGEVERATVRGELEGQYGRGVILDHATARRLFEMAKRAPRAPAQGAEKAFEEGRAT